MTAASVVSLWGVIPALLYGGIGGCMQVGWVVKLKNRAYFPFPALLYCISPLPYLYCTSVKTALLYTCILVIVGMPLTFPLYRGFFSFYLYNYLMQQAIVLCNIMLSLRTACRFPAVATPVFLAVAIVSNSAWLIIMYILHIRVFTRVPLPVHYYHRSQWHCVFSFLIFLLGIYYAQGDPGDEVLLFFALCSIAVIFFSLWEVSDANEEMLREQELKSIDLQRIYLSQQVKDQLDFNDETRRLRHDYSHQLGTILQLIEMGETERARLFTTGLLEDFQTQQVPTYCADPVINTVLSSFSSRCANQRISFDCTVRLPDNVLIRDSDIAALLMNILTNAAEAVEKLPPEAEHYIRVVIYTRNEYLVVKCDNPIDTVPLIEGGRIRSTKTDSTELHGIGLESIHKTCGKYEGRVTLSAQEHSFSLTAILKNQTPAEAQNRADSFPEEE